MSKFSIGDRVVATRDGPEGNYSIHANDSGIVCQIMSSEFGANIGVWWDHPITRGHNCGGTCEEGFGWRVRVDDLKHLEVETEADFEIDENAFMEILKRT